MFHIQSVYSVKREELSEEEIIERKLFNVFVFSLPRCGSSMMTHICELLGVNMIHTSEEKKHDYPQLGKDYHPNETGFYEVTQNMMQNYLKIAGTPYGGCKMIIPVDNIRFDLVKSLPSKVIMMERNPEEIRQSQNAFYSSGADIAYIRTALVQEKLKLKNHKIDHIIVNYRDVIKDTQATIQRVKDFILSDKDIKAAVDFVNPDAYRFDADKITEGL
ncbi:MAG: hypothetical protein ACI9Y8_001359 [Candidatus Omnitrophota bacterium]|jgi:hypothetical protein